MYVVDGANSTVTVLNRDGTVVRSWGRKGEGEGEFNEPWGIAVAPDGSVFVADTWNHRIQKFTREGQFIAQWGGHETGTTPGRFYGPRDVAISPAGELLVTDTGNKRIQVFNQQGMFLRAFGTEGGAPGQFREPVGLAVDGSGRIYVADTWNQRIQVFDASFNPLAQHAVPGWVGSGVTNKPYIAVTANGDVFATVPERAGVVRVKDGVTSQLPLPQNPRLVIPTGIDIDGSGRLVVADAQAGVVVGFDVISAAVDETRETAVGAED
jgi:DNA-binding beta-propeller fold protein YncE